MQKIFIDQETWEGYDRPISLTVRSPAPEFKLPASTGGEIGLSNFRDKNNVYLFFVRDFN